MKSVAKLGKNLHAVLFSTVTIHRIKKEEKTVVYGYDNLESVTDYGCERL